MTYLKQLHPWCIIRILPNIQQLNNAGAYAEINQQSNIVARFRKRADAVAYLQVLEHSIKNIKFLIIFDVQGVSKLSDDA
ncbi:MAG: hypothetical protein IGS39_04305 [Calothrix sp. C42_A2020_038]|nr:hypothetical protein [Calothrix sp. C42_A2020_038]